ncbi:NUDIX domain-containing protein [Patescibacteria group bacterium]|nr:NUDIX domain-containing protein [Patescibacteria group bacterium]
MKSKNKRFPRPRVVREKSCGIIVFRTENSIREYLLLHYPGGHWDYPKGHVEERDSSEKETACRELQEETGITKIKFIPGFREPMYYQFFRGKSELVKKTVVYFLAEVQQIDVVISFEHQGFIWLPYSEAMKKLTFENARNLLNIAEDIMQSHTKNGY